MRTRDLALIVVAFLGIAGGVFTPQWAVVFSPVTIYMMMTILYLSFLRIDFGALARLRRADLAELAWWGLIKLVLLPVALWFVFRWLAPGWALPVLLLSGVSAGVTAPFFSQLLGGDTARTLQLTVLTSVLVPLSLPALVELLAGAEINIPFGHMVRMLAQVIFIPLALAWLTRRLAPALVDFLGRVQFPLILALFFCINLGVFAPFAPFFFSQSGQVLAAAGIACGLAALYFGVVWLMGPLSGWRLDLISCGCGLIFINNVLVVVFAANFFGPRNPLLAALYLLPLYVMLLPLRLLASRQSRTATPGDKS
ncbi:MAG: bile acid:sodium symporter [Proteobacteria bacterium]|nr:bile acid:sodium symporter [Pseudomonadota bacterium]MBU2470081.1 bile acid:sodium symporter [Pseudomonadota bacterium]MBU2516385.1 bile acid:sodium symporter [Pseudomonadota bacterium]